MKSLIFYSQILFLLIIPFFIGKSVGQSSAECSALADIYSYTNGAGWTTKWPSKPPTTGCTVVCTLPYSGITCTGGHIFQLLLSTNNLVGTIPPSIGNLTYLTNLNLGYNQLNGAIPSTIGNLVSLQNLDLSSNYLSSTIPTSIGNLASLQFLFLSGNSLSGTIPNSIGNLTSLTSLQLNYNALTGQIPTSIGNLASLQFLLLGSNSLSGPIPNSIGNLTSLTSLQLNYNALTGQIPTSIGNLASLQFLLLGSNSLSGPIPNTIGNLISLTSLDLSVNVLNGTIPSNVGNLGQLQTLSLSNNLLSGPIPNTIGNLISLTSLQMFVNQLSGQIPSTMYLLTSLTTCQIASGNSFCHVSGQTFPTHCYADLNTTPFCPVSTTTTSSTTTTTTTSTTTTTTTSTTTTTTTKLASTTTTTSTLATTSTTTSSTTTTSTTPTTTTTTTIATTTTANGTDSTSSSALATATSVPLTSPSSSSQAAATPTVLIIVLTLVSCFIVFGSLVLWWWLGHRTSDDDDKAAVKAKEVDLMEVRTPEGITSTAGLLNNQSDYIKTVLDNNQATMFALPGDSVFEMNRDIVIIGELVQGGSGEIQVGEMLHPAFAEKEKNVIVKLPKRNQDPKTAKAIWQKEVGIMWALKDNQNIARLIGYIEEPIGLVIHRYAASLQALILKEVNMDMLHEMTPSEALEIAIGITNGMGALHDASILHLDLKSTNVLIDLTPNGSYLPAITNFDSAQTIGSEVMVGQLNSKVRGTSAHYASPEAIHIFRDGEMMSNHLVIKEDAFMDCYSFGIILYELLERKLAWEGMSSEEICSRVLKGQRPVISQDVEDMKDGTVGIIMNVMRKAWAIDRPSFQLMKEMLN